MSKTAVGLFQRPSVADQVVHDLDASAFPRKNIRILGEPREMPGDGVMNTSRTDFEVALNQQLHEIGASDREANAYVRGVRRGGVLVFATGSNEQVDNAAKIMDRHGAIKVEELMRGELEIDTMIDDNMTPLQDDPLQTGRISQPGCGARVFVW